MRKVFIGDYRIEFKAAGVTLSGLTTKHEITIIVNEIKSHSLNTDVVIVDDTSDSLWNLFMDKFKKVVAAGGVVINDDSKLLLIERNQVWDLPKGKLEKGETTEKAATREVSEETGLQRPVVNSEPVETWHVYDLYGDWTLKKTVWFVMYATGDHNLMPQSEEGITEVGWFEIEDAISMLNAGYRSIKEVLVPFILGFFRNNLT